MPSPGLQELKTTLDALVRRYERPAFIDDDPIAIPHGFDDPRDQEVIGLYAALLAWGRRSVVLDKMAELCERMGHAPYRFVRAFDAEADGDALDGFVHRTFQPVDALWLTKNLSAAIERHGGTVEGVFAAHLPENGAEDTSGRYTLGPVGQALQGFSRTLLDIDPETPERLRKHLARPAAGSACKRLNMYLRWMVRGGPVDLGLWSCLQPRDLMLPVDVHVGRQARSVGLLERKSNDWTAVRRLTDLCRRLCPDDPARYDFAFFASGAQDDPLEDRFTSEAGVDSSSPPTP